MRRLLMGHRKVFYLVHILFLLAVVGADAHGQDRAPRFEPSECPIPTTAWANKARIECGRVIVPESRVRPNGKTVGLAVAVFRALSPSGAPPLVMLHGGPGGTGLQSNFVQQASRWPIAGRRDIVIYDQRGAGLSEPRLCPEIVDNLAGDTSPTEVVRACVASLKAAGRDAAAYNTQENAADAVDLRRVLGYDKWDVYGISYGTRIAQELMRRDGPAIRSVVLTGVLPPGPEPYLEVNARVQEAFERIFARCRAQPACAEAFPTVAEDFYAVYEQLTETPLNLPQPGTSEAIRLDGVRFMNDLRSQLNRPERLPLIPMLIRELHHGDRMRAAQMLISPPDQRRNATTLLVSAFDVCGSKTLRGEADAIRAKVGRPFRELTSNSNIHRVCDVLQEGIADSSTFAPITSDIPTLIFSGEFDDRTPAAYGRRVAETLRHVYQYEIPREAHGQVFPGCHESILAQFLDSPVREPDATCVKDLPPVAFETKTLDAQRFTFTITSTGQPSNIFAGNWEAVVPGPYGVTRIDLQVSGTTLTGAISVVRATIQITEGRIDRGDLVFKATSGDGDRTITVRGKLEGDEISFAREFVVRPGGASGGQGIFGAAGPSTFVARRID